MAKKELDTLKELFDRVQETYHQAEKNALKAFNHLATRFYGTQAEAKKRVDEVLTHLTAKDLTSRLQIEEALHKLASVRHDVETRVEEGTEHLLAKIGIATKADIEQVNRKIVAVNRKLKQLETKRGERTRLDA